MPGADFRVLVDGIDVGTVDPVDDFPYSIEGVVPDDRWQLRQYLVGLTPGPHEIEFVFTRVATTFGRGYHVAIDA